MNKNTLCAALLVAALGTVPARAEPVRTITYDFDTAKPTLTLGAGLPAWQYAGGVMAYFDCPGRETMSIQSDVTTGYNLPKLEAKYLWSDTIKNGVLEIAFNRPVTSVSLIFATLDYPDMAKVPNNVELRAYTGSIYGKPVATNLSHANYDGSMSLPVGVMSVDRGGMPFTAVTVAIPPDQPWGTRGLVLDDVTVVPGKCAMDMDSNGLLDAFDIMTFLDNWFAGDMRADYGGTGALEVQDIVDYINAWFGGEC